MIVLAMTMVNIPTLPASQNSFSKNVTEFSLILHKKALVEERECHQDYCLSKCPAYVSCKEFNEKSKGSFKTNSSFECTESILSHRRTSVPNIEIGEQQRLEFKALEKNRI